eukprot:TRINITY_DN11018_c0_g1_i1.p1 TRINITY_DN11018_c0_g1~~TRINITY_DN11018_c0_g1_i1.p1  ORF type:complete len:569 (+),score=125.30 TRINITY_DN11018_c0_g1_i1:66-1772(+)
MAEKPRDLPRSDEHVDPKQKLHERLANNDPLPDVMNHYAVLEKLEKFESDIDCLAAMVHGLVSIYSELEANKPWPPKEILGELMCTKQLHSLFGHCRVPNVQTGRDAIHMHPQARHIALMVHGSMFELRVFEDAGVPVRGGVLREHIAKAVAMAEELAKTGLGEGADLSCFTALPRGEWGKVRSGLLMDPRNEGAIRCAESSLFIASLDRAVFEGVGWDVAAYYGDGNTRWFDHCLNLSVRDCSAALVVEESDADSFGLSWLCNELLARVKSDAYPARDPTPAPTPEPPAAPTPEQLGAASEEPTGDTVTAGDADDLPPPAKREAPTYLEHHPAAPDMSPMPVAECVRRCFQPQARGAETVVLPSFAVLLFDLPATGATGDALVDVAGALAYYRLKQRIADGMGRVGLHRYEGGRNVNHMPIPSREARAFIKAVCKDSEERVFQSHELGRVLLKALEVGAAARKRAEQGYTLCPDSLHGGHVPLYTSESVWMPEEGERGGQYRIYGSQALHFTYTLAVGKPGNVYSFVWKAPAFDEFAQHFEAAMDECVGLLEGFARQNPTECRTMQK